MSKVETRFHFRNRRVMRVQSRARSAPALVATIALLAS
jgi:hypothetical protein